MAGVVGLAAVGARAQPMDPIDALLQRQALSPVQTPLPTEQTVRQPLSTPDLSTFRTAIEAAKRGDVNGARVAIAGLADPAARKAATWVLVDLDGDSLTFAEVDKANRDLAGWPRPSRREAAAEKLIETSGKTPRQIVDWFDGHEPQTAQGAMALATADRMLGQTDEATNLIRRWWRDKSFDVETQRAILSRFGAVLTNEDHTRRADVLLYGPENQAVREMVAVLPPDQQLAAQARLALRRDASDAIERVSALSPALQQSPGVAFERAAYLRRKGLTELAIAQLPYFPKEAVTPEQGQRIWDERHQMVLAALKAGDAKAAYTAAAETGIVQGAPAAEAEFYAGWISLTRLKDPERAAKHFALIDRVSGSPITRARALYWQGRAAEARGEQSIAQSFYAAAAQHSTTFYGQLGGEKLGQKLVLPDDVVLTAADRARFESSDVVQAARLYRDNGERELFRLYAITLSEVLPTVADEALLVDMVRGYGDQDASMKIARNAAQRGLILPQRAYPYRTPPQVSGAAEPALVLAITRQESNFDPLIRSGVGARGMMQLMPSTAAIMARRVGVSFSPGRLDEPDYNMRLGSVYLGELVNRFSGSYVMAIAAYNAGPGRPAAWASYCGDPRAAGSDPIDFIECIPFAETRNYVMRVMESTQVYRAKLNGGSAPLTLSADLSRGSYGYAGSIPPVASAEP